MNKFRKEKAGYRFSLKGLLTDVGLILAIGTFVTYCIYKFLSVLSGS